MTTKAKKERVRPPLISGDVAAALDWGGSLVVITTEGAVLRLIAGPIEKPEWVEYPPVPASTRWHALHEYRVP